ncbi:MAG: hypothetical protein R2810_00600 [Flavobacteriales bacterium]
MTAEVGVNDGNSGYQFWLFDPNSSWPPGVLQPRQPDGGCASRCPGRAAHLRFGNLIANPVPVDQMLSVRIRGRVNRTFNEFSPTCQVMW